MGWVNKIRVSSKFEALSVAESKTAFTFKPAGACPKYSFDKHVEKKLRKWEILWCRTSSNHLRLVFLDTFQPC